MRRKYAVCPGWITSHNDGERHFIGAGDLMRLHRVNPAECIVLTDYHKQAHLAGMGRDLIGLYPQYDYPSREGETER